MALELIKDFKHNTELRESFNELTREVFGFTFEDWYSLGYWGDQYRCFSLADQGRIIANSSFSTWDFVIDGEARRAVQIGTVMTHPDYRGQGLAAKLVNEVLQEHEGKCDFMFLMANETVLDFYPRFGFQRIGQNTFTAPAGAVSCSSSGAGRLDLTNSEDIAVLERLAENRVPISQCFGVRNDQSILMFYLTGPYAKDIYYLPQDDIAVVMRIRDEVLHVYDILSPKHFTQESVIRQVLTSEVKRVAFHFTPDGSFPDVEVSEWKSEDGLFIRPANFTLPQSFVFPALSIT